MKPFEPALSSCCTNQLDESLFASLSEHGIHAMEISLPTELYAKIPWKECESWSKATDVELWSIHLPFYPFEALNPASSSRDVRKKTVDTFTELMQRAASIGVKVAVVHPSGEPIAAEARTEAMKCSKDTCAQLAEIGARCGMTVALEDLPRSCFGRDSSEMLQLLSADERLRSCFDTNHLLSESPLDYIRAIGSKIVTMHCSDYDGKNERHWLPGEGILPWQEMLSVLCAVGYSGPFLYEVNLTTPNTISRRDLTFADFRDNYDQLMRGEIPSAIGRPIPERCLQWNA